METMQYSCFCFGQAEHAEFQNARYIGLFGGQRVGNIYAWKNFCVIGNFFAYMDSDLLTPESYMSYNRKNIGKRWCDVHGTFNINLNDFLLNKKLI